MYMYTHTHTHTHTDCCTTTTRHNNLPRKSYHSTGGAARINEDILTALLQNKVFTRLATSPVLWTQWRQITDLCVNGCLGAIGLVVTCTRVRMVFLDMLIFVCMHWCWEHWGVGSVIGSPLQIPQKGGGILCTHTMHHLGDGSIRGLWRCMLKYFCLRA